MGQTITIAEAIIVITLSILIWVFVKTLFQTFKRK